MCIRDRLKTACEKFKNKIAISLDVKDGFIFLSGWKKKTNITLVWTTPDSVSSEFHKLHQKKEVNAEGESRNKGGQYRDKGWEIKRKCYKDRKE